VKGAPSFDGAHTWCRHMCADAHSTMRTVMAYESRAETLTLSRELIETFIRNYVFFPVFNTRASRLTRILIHPRDTWETRRVVWCVHRVFRDSSAWFNCVLCHC